MRVTLFFIVLGVLTTSAKSFSQQKFNLNYRGTSIRQILKELHETTDFDFVYSNDDFDTNQKVDLIIENGSVNEMMDNLLRDTGMGYNVVDNVIIIAPKTMSNFSRIGDQKQAVTGKVTDSSGAPLPGVSVVIKGTTSGVITDADGKYSLTDVPGNATLVFSFVGMKKEEIEVKGMTTVNVSLTEEVVGVDEIVVVGYGTQKKVNLTGSVSAVDVSKLTETRPITNISHGLAGLTPGLYVKSSDNDPGSNATLLLRGQGTLNTSSPLIIIDGVESNINSVAPEDIASISVLKDAASAAIYGSRAANGVILITTRQAESGKIRISYNGYMAAQSIANKMPLVSNSVEYMEMLNEGCRNSGKKEYFSAENIQNWKDHEGDDPLLWPNTNWIDATFRTARTMNHYISAEGGTDRVRSFLSASIFDTPGIVENTGYKKIGIRSNNRLKVTSWLEVGMDLNGSHSDKDSGSSALSSLFTNSVAFVPTCVNRSKDGRYGGTNNTEDNQNIASPLWYVNQYKGDNITRAFSSRFSAVLTPLQGLTITGSYNYYFSDNKTTTKPTQNDRWNFQTNTIITSGTTRLYITNTDTRESRTFMDGDIAYERNFFDKLNFKIMGGASQEYYNHEKFSAMKYDLINEEMNQINGATGSATASGAATEYAMISYFGRINFDWAEKYLLELNFRRDGSSRFLSKNRWGNFPSISAGWRISEEPFMSSLKDSWLDQLKVRASYGSLGNNSVGNYDAISTLSSTKYVLNNALVTGYYQAKIANGNLKWESTYVTNFGFDFGLFNRLNASIDLYDKTTKNILIDLPAPLVRGTASIPKSNSAKVRNRGIELALDWKGQINNNINYFIQGNFTYNSNKVVKYKGDEYSLSGTYILKEGLPIKTQYVLLTDRIVETDEDLALVQKYINDAPLDVNGNKQSPFQYGAPVKGDLLYRDKNGDGLINSDDRDIVGHGVNPRYLFGLTLGASYKGFDFSCQMDGVAGIKSYLNNDYYTSDLRYSIIENKEIIDGRWYEGRTSPAKYPRVTVDEEKNVVASDFWIQDNSYLKIRSIMLGYTIPKRVTSKYSIGKLKIYAELENYFTFTKYHGLDPELTSVTYPTMKQAVLGINLSF